MTALKPQFRRAWRFATADVWDIDIASLSRARAWLVRLVRVLHLVVRGFYKDDCPMHASALTYTTLMSIVPVLAMSLAVARGLGGEDLAKARIRRVVADWTRGFASASVATPAPAATNAAALDAAGAAAAVADPAAPAPRVSEDTEDLATQINRALENGFDKIENINFKALGGVGLALLLWMVILVLGQVESSFNRVWGVTAGRPIWRKFTDYLSMLFVLPILTVAASSLPLMDLLARHLPESSVATVRTVLGSGPIRGIAVYGISTLSFTLLLLFMPHTRVRLGPGLAGGAATAALFLGWLRVCAALQVGAARYGKIYGSFALVPIVLAWVYVSWQIILLGAELAFAIQNYSTYRMEQGAERASPESRLLLTLSLVGHAARALLGGQGFFDAAAYGQARNVPVRLLNEVIGDLTVAGLLAELSEPRGRYTLLRAPTSLPVSDIVRTVLRSTSQRRAVDVNQLEPWAREAVARATGSMETAMGELTVADLVGGPDAARKEPDTP